MNHQIVFQVIWGVLMAFGFYGSMSKHGKPIFEEGHALHVHQIWHVFPGAVTTFLVWWGMGFWSAPVQPWPQVAWVVYFLGVGMVKSILNHGRVARYSTPGYSIGIMVSLALLFWSGLFHL